MAQVPSDTILVAIRITLRIRESKVRNPVLRIGGGLYSLSISSFGDVVCALRLLRPGAMLPLDTPLSTPSVTHARLHSFTSAPFLLSFSGTHEWREHSQANQNDLELLITTLNLRTHK